MQSRHCCVVAWSAPASCCLKGKNSLCREAFKTCHEAWLTESLGWTEGVPSASKRVLLTERCADYSTQCCVELLPEDIQVTPNICRG